MPRYVTYKGRTSALVFAACGVLAGDTFATKMVRAYTACAMATLARMHPSIRIVMVVDDVGLTCVGQPSQVVRCLVPACAQLDDLVGSQLHARLAGEI